MTSEKTPRRTFGSLRLRGRIWWLRYRIDGKEHWESSRSASRAVAEKLLARREVEAQDGTLTAPEFRRVTFADLETMLRTDYRVKQRRSLPRIDSALSHLRAAFGATRAIAITSDRVTTYQVDRLDAGAARATINYELALLKHALRLAVTLGKLRTAPAIVIPKAQNERTGFFEPADFAAVLTELPEHLRPVMRFAYLTGWRVRSEVVPLTWDRVDFAAGTVTLDRNTTKSGEPRTFPFDALPELHALLTAQREATSTLERSAGQIIPFVFHRRGAQIKSYKNAWQAACDRASTRSDAGTLTVIVRPQIVGKLVHDFRRTAVRNLVRAGVDEQIAMKLTGHKTRAVFDRYNITNAADLRAGVAKLAAHLNEPQKRPKVTDGGQSRKKRSAGGQAS